jgi:hypothetical protein
MGERGITPRGCVVVQWPTFIVENLAVALCYCSSRVFTEAPREKADGEQRAFRPASSHRACDVEAPTWRH